MKSKEIEYKLHKNFIYEEEDLSDDLKSKVYVVNGNCFTILPCKVECDACGGTKINNIVDYKSLTPQQEKILSINDRCINEEAYDIAYAESERAMGA